MKKTLTAIIVSTISLTYLSGASATEQSTTEQETTTTAETVTTQEPTTTSVEAVPAKPVTGTPKFTG